MNSKIELITPQKALEYLSKNTNNRTLKKSTVEAIARDIIRGTFITTHQGIAFDEDGVLIDGQHRLRAVIAARKPVEMMVTRGVPKETRNVVDRGTSRTIRDLIVMTNNGDDHYSVVMRSQQMVSAINQMVACNYKHIKMTYVEQMRFFDSLKPQVVIAYRTVVSRKMEVRNVQIVSAVIAALFYGVKEESLLKFFNVFNTADINGCDDYNIQASLNWRRQIDNAKADRITINANVLYGGTQSAIYHFVNNTKHGKINPKDPLPYDMAEEISKILAI